MPGISELLYPATAVVAWLLVLAKVRHMRRDRGNPAHKAMVAAFFFLAVAFTIGSPGVWQLLNCGPHGDMATLYAQSAVICAMAAIVALLLGWNYAPELATARIRRRLAFLAGMLIAMITMYLMIDPQHSRTAGNLADWYASSTTFVAYILIYQTIYAVTLIDIIVLCRRFNRAVTDRSVHAALIMTALGALIGLLYTAVRLLDIAVAPFGISLTPLEPVAELGTSLGAVLVLGGLTLPSWAGRLAAIRAYNHQRRCYQAMEPLWRALAEASPDIVLEPARRSAWLRRGEFQFQLRRRIIEIHDAELTLRAYRDRHAEHEARTRSIEAGLTGIAAAAYVEAACLRAALAAKQGGCEGDCTPPDQAYAGSNIDDELHWLTAVSEAFSRTLSATPVDQGVHA